jgi:hypothetical protein
MEILKVVVPVTTPNYLIVLEIYDIGWLIEVVSNKETARVVANKLWEAVMPTFNWQNVKYMCPFPYIERYKICGNTHYVMRDIDISMGNGGVTVHVVAINPTTFCPKTFAKERENSSWLLFLENDNEEANRLLDFSERYTEYAFWAN